MSGQGTPKSIEIYMPSGDPRGIRKAQLRTRIVIVIELPREELERFAAMPEARQVGIYFLVGKDADTERDLLYIGHTHGLSDRLREHRKKSFWTRALVAITTAETFTQTHTQYLEWRAIEMAKRMERYSLDNQNAGTQPRLPDALRADCEEIFDTMALLLATLGFPIFEPVLKPESSAGARPLLLCKGSSADGRGYYSDDGLVVLKGSSGRRENVLSIRGTSDERFREVLLREGVVRLEGERIVFERDYPFSSPSSAAVALTGRTANGWIEWKDASGRTLKDLRAEGLA